MTSDAVAAQVRAATPAASSWVSANAGSGKTRVLTDRVARLLLAGTEPQKHPLPHLHQGRGRRDAEPAVPHPRRLGDARRRRRCARRCAALGEPGEAIPPDRLARARTLFARALETPGGLRIQTIHAFCEALLRRFPLEAGVAPQFARARGPPGPGAARGGPRRARRRRGPTDFAALARHLPGDDPDPLLARDRPAPRRLRRAVRPAPPRRGARRRARR